MKKITAVILCIVLAFSVFSCVAFAEDSLPSPDDIVYVEPTYPEAEKTKLFDLMDSIFGKLASDQNGPFAQFISAARNFFEQAVNVLQPLIQSFAGSFDTTDTSALQSTFKKLIASL